MKSMSWIALEVKLTSEKVLKKKKKIRLNIYFHSSKKLSSFIFIPVENKRGKNKKL